MATFLSSRRYEALASILLLISLVRIVFSYSHTAQAFDEPSHIAAGIEFLDKRTYLLDPTHPPLAPIAIGFPLFVAGERYPALAPDDPGSHNYNVVGNKVIYDSGRFRRNLALARIGVIPFFLLGAFVVWLWALRVGGKRAGLVAVFLYTTTPTVLAFSSVAYTDIGAASMHLAAMFSFLLWLATPNRRNAVWLGAFLGLAVATKFTRACFKIDSASNQALTCRAGCRLSFCYEEPAEAIDRRAVGVDGTLVSSA